MKKKYRAFFTFSVISSALISNLFFFTPAQAHSKAHLMVGSVPSWFSGSYGTAHTLNIFYVPTYVQYKKNRLKIKLTMAYESVTGLPKGAILAGSNLSSRTTQSQTQSASGIADTWLTVRYTAIHERGRHPSIRPYLKIKFATASSTSGLGTGRNDYELGVGFDDRIGNWTFPFAHIGYRFVGKPSGYALQNITTYDVGASVVLPHARANILTAMFSGSQSEEKGYAGPADIIVAWNHNLTQTGSGLQVYFDKGLTHGSANYGVGIGGQVAF